MLKNKPIRNRTETIGFLLIITKILVTIATNEKISTLLGINPLVIVSLKIKRLFMSITLM
jgi:hypothetical protein